MQPTVKAANYLTPVYVATCLHQSQQTSADQNQLYTACLQSTTVHTYNETLLPPHTVQHVNKCSNQQIYCSKQRKNLCKSMICVKCRQQQEHYTPKNAHLKHLKTRRTKGQHILIIYVIGASPLLAVSQENNPVCKNTILPISIGFCSNPSGPQANATKLGKWSLNMDLCIELNKINH